MRALEILLERRWILKSREKELYYQIKDELGTVKKFLMEKLGYQVIVNPYLVKVEKMPATPENWMGIQEFTRKIEYVFFCMILMFLEEKEAEEQFVLSELTEYIQGQYREEQIDWTVYQYRRHLIKVIKYCVNCGILNLNDGSEENFARDDTSEVLYENTGVSRYFMKNFTQDIMGYTTPEDQAEKESLSDSDTVKLKQREVEIKSQLEGLKKNITGKQRQEEEKKEKYQETEQKIQLQFQKNEMLWEEIENSLEYMEEEHETHFDVRVYTFEEGKKLLEAGDIDIAFGLSSEFSVNPDISYETIHQSETCIVCSRKNRLSQYKSINPILVKDEPMITLSSQMGRKFYDDFMKAFILDGFEPNIVKEVNSLSEYFISIKLDEGIGYTGREVVPEEEDLCTVKIVGSHHHADFAVAYLKENKKQSVVQFYEYIVAYFKDYKKNL